MVINVALYVGGLVLTAAALALVAVVQSPAVTAGSLVAAYVVFAVVGFWLAAYVPVVKPAGMAIFGTSLAILAVAAIPLNEAIIGNGFLTWLLVSLTGVVIYGAASVHLDSRVLGYLAVPFLYSAVFSSTAVLQQPLVWTWVGVILLCTVIQTAVIILGDRVPTLLSRPFGQLHWFVVPAVTVASALLFTELGSVDYALIFAAAAVSCVVTAVRPAQPRLRPLWALGARVAASISVLALFTALSLELDAFAAASSLWFAGLFVAVAYLPLMTGQRREDLRRDLPAEPVGAPAKPPGAEKSPSGAAAENSDQSVASANPLSAVDFRRYVPLREGDVAGSFAVAVAAGLVGLAALLLQSALSGPQHLYAVVVVVTLLAAIAVWARKAPQISLRSPAARTGLALATLLGIPHHPWYSLAVIAAWIALESWLSTDQYRPLWRRALSALAAATLGWALGHTIDDATLALRFAVIGALAAATALTIMLTRRDAGRIPERWCYWLIAAAATILGAGVLRLDDVPQSLWAAGSIALIYTLLVATIASVGRTSGEHLTEEVALGRTVGFLAASAVIWLSVDASALADAGTFRAGPPPLLADGLWAGLILVGLTAAEVAAGRRVQHYLTDPSRLRHWAPLHLTVTGLWLAVLSLVAIAADTAEGLWWIIAILWAGLAATYLSFSAARDTADHPDAAGPDRVVARFYAAAVGVLVLLAYVVGTPWWWTDAAVAAAALVVGVVALRMIPRQPETPYAVPLFIATGSVLLISSLWSTIIPGTLGSEPVAGLVAATMGIGALTGAAAYATRSPTLHTGATRLAMSSMVLIAATAAIALARTPAAGGTSHVRVWLQPQVLDVGLRSVLALVAVLTLYLVLARTLSRADLNGDTVLVMRLSTFAASAVIIGVVGLWGDAVQFATTGPASSAELWAAVCGLLLVIGLAAAEIATARSVRSSPAHRWAPAHLSVNAVWLALINLLMALTGVSGDLIWFTTVTWAVSCAVFLRAHKHSGGTGSINLRIARLYGAGVMLLAVLAWVLGDLWWSQLAAALAVTALAAIVLVWGEDLAEALWAGPVVAAVGVGMALSTVLTSTVEGPVGSEPAAVGYLSCAAAFATVAGYALWGRRRLHADPRRRDELGVACGGMGLIVSLVPLITAEHQVTPVLALSVPLMHAVLAAVGIRLRRVRVPAGLISSLVLPVSGLFAYLMWRSPADTEISVTALIMLGALLSAEAVLVRGRAASPVWSRTYYLCAAAVTLFLMLFGVGGDGLVAAAPLAAGAALVTFGLLRAQRLGVYAGSATLILAVLWALRDAMFLLLVFLGALIIGAAIWRLVVNQKRQQQSSPGHDTSPDQRRSPTDVNTSGH